MLSTSDPPELPYPWKCPQLRHKVPPQGSQSPPFPYVVTLMAPSHHSSVRIKPAPKLTSQSEIHRILCSNFYRQQSKRKLFCIALGFAEGFIDRLITNGYNVSRQRYLIKYSFH